MLTSLPAHVETHQPAFVKLVPMIHPAKPEHRRPYRVIKHTCCVGLCRTESAAASARDAVTTRVQGAYDRVKGAVDSDGDGTTASRSYTAKVGHTCV